MSKFNGYKNWNHWNVSLWINNDEGLYREALYLIDLYGDKDIAAAFLVKQLPDKTPDGAPYSKTAIRAALVGL
jgi:hypothetical protein